MSRRYARVIGSGSMLPGEPVSNDQLIARHQIDSSDQWIVERTGIQYRHFIAPEGRTSDLALQACQAALSAAGKGAADIDLVIVATSTPDYIFPSTATILQGRLGIHNGSPAFDVQAVCGGFIYAVAVAEKFIASGSHQCALVVGAEVFSRILDWQDRTTSVLFGDGAGAVVLAADDKPGVLTSVLHADGRYTNMLSVPGSVAGGQVIGDPFLRMQGQAVFRFAVTVLSEAVHEALQKTGLTLDDIDWFVPHQANVRIIDATARKLGLSPQKVISTVDRHANTSAASIPLAFDNAMRQGKMQNGQKVMLVGVGGGFAWGAILVQL